MQFLSLHLLYDCYNLWYDLYVYVCVCVFVPLRADSDRAAPHANAAYHGKGVPTGHARRASAGTQYCACHVPLPGPADQNTFPFPGTTPASTEKQPASWIQPQLHHSPAGRHTTRAGDCSLRLALYWNEDGFFFYAFVSHSNFHKLKFCFSVHIKIKRMNFFFF